MWLEVVNQFNFNVGFSTTQSDVLVHLAQWQYWWWFWFSFLWCFYYLVFNKTFRHRVLKMRPKISTSYRPHGKWGDFLACIVPGVWCINILTNSNLILRLIEWQNESNLFTIRIRGRQWYWIYKFEIKNFTDILTTPKNVGNNRWIFNVFGDLCTTNDYLHVLQLRSQSKWVQSYWNDFLVRDAKSPDFHITSSIEQSKLYSSILNTEVAERFNDFVLNDDTIVANNLKSLYSTNLLHYVMLNKNFFSALSVSDNFYSLFNNLKELSLSNISIVFKRSEILFSNFLNFVKTNYFNVEVLESTRWAKKSVGLHNPIRLKKEHINYLTEHDSYDSKQLFDIKFGSGDNNIQSKPTPHTKYLTLKQQRVKKKKLPPIQKSFKLENNEGEMVQTRLSGYPILVNNSLLEINNDSPQIEYRMMSKNKIRNEHIPVTLARRILRTKRILVVPAHVNITTITNSYDVVHSWFIPGLGLKFDCVPGRSTHHTFFIDSVGFYYGQCAEICGRYHHHMPIRLCALQFEHFLVWWQSFGSTKLLSTLGKKKFNDFYSFRKFVW